MPFGKHQSRLRHDRLGHHDIEGEETGGMNLARAAWYRTPGPHSYANSISPQASGQQGLGPDDSPRSW